MERHRNGDGVKQRSVVTGPNIEDCPFQCNCLVEGDSIIQGRPNRVGFVRPIVLQELSTGVINGVIEVRRGTLESVGPAHVQNAGEVLLHRLQLAIELTDEGWLEHRHSTDAGDKKANGQQQHRDPRHLGAKGDSVPAIREGLGHEGNRFREWG